MVIPTEDINKLVKALAAYAASAADYDEADYLIQLRDELQDRLIALLNP